MNLLYFLTLAAASAAPLNTSDPASVYKHAMDQISLLPPKFDGKSPLYTHENLHRGIHVPQYDARSQNYEAVSQLPPNGAFEALKNLHLAAELGSSQASLALADIYTFGNFSVPTNYSRALEYYQKTVESAPSGRAYFMLGHMYATGMFGEVPVDKQKARIYHEFAARNGDTNAMLVLASSSLAGVDCALNCETAQFYYSRIARQVIKNIEDQNIDVHEDLLSHNINVADFSGGFYGDKISESESSVLTEIDTFVQLRDSLREKNLESPDSPLLDYYFDALQHYHGGYFAPRNATKAYVEALTCAYLGQDQFGDNPQNPSTIDKFIWMKCQGLVGRMYLAGEGVQRDVSRAHFWLSSAVSLKPDKENLLDMALLRKLDPTTHGELSPSCKGYLQDAAKNGSTHGVFLYAKSLVAPRSPFETSYIDSTYDLVKTSAYRGHYQATFYFADAVESGYAAAKGELFGCPDLASFYKNFVERSESFLLPHLSYAFEELRYGNYKNALLGYSMAAEQGLLNSQLSAAFLLYQMEPLFSWKRKTFHPERVQGALKYLDLASAQGHIDSTILLGDLYLKGLPSGGPQADHDKAFAYYNAAASSASAHACYKLGYMYEYGLGVANNSSDYYMAKRYYDFSTKYYQDHSLVPLNGGSKPNTYAIGYALLRLRLKFLFSRTQKRDDSEASGWLGTLKKLAKSKESEILEEKASAKAQAHAEGETYEEEEDYQLFDYAVLIFTLAFFLYVGFQNLRGQFRRVGRNAGADHANEANRPRFQVEFFFAI